MRTVRDKTLLWCSAGSQFEKQVEMLPLVGATVIPDRAVIADAMRPAMENLPLEHYLYVRDHSPAEEPNRQAAPLEWALWKIMMDAGGPQELVWDGSRKLYAWNYKMIDPELVAQTVVEWMQKAAHRFGVHRVFYDFLWHHLEWQLDVIDAIHIPVIANGKAASHGDATHNLRLAAALAGCFHQEANMWAPVYNGQNLLALTSLPKRRTEIFDSFGNGLPRQSAMRTLALAHDDGYWCPYRMTNEGALRHWRDYPQSVAQLHFMQRLANPEEPPIPTEEP